MQDELEKCLRVLGLAPGATEQAIKEAYRDLVKVWHPDRFGTDARLREKAQEKLKELNAAFDRLRGGRPADPTASRRRQPSGATDAQRPDDAASSTVNVSGPAGGYGGPKSWRMAATLLTSAAVGGAGVWLLVSGRRDVQEPPRANEAFQESPSSRPTRTSVAPDVVKRESAEPGSAPAGTPLKSPGAATTGSLRVNSQPAGARVSFDGEVVGETPIVVSHVAPGEHQIVVDLEMKGYQPWSASVIVVAGREEKLLAVMTPTASRR